MKLAVIADIHGNLPALEAVLEDVSLQGADRLVVNGDMVNRGPRNVEVLERLAVTDAPLVLGNHDDLLRMWVDRDHGLPTEWFGDPFWEGTAWCARQLEQAGLVDALRDLPMIHRIELPEAPRLLIAHGSPRHYREGYGRYLSDEDIEEIGGDFGAEVLVGSHTHVPMLRSHQGVTVVNSGAVGTPFNGDRRAQYLMLSLSDGVWLPEFRQVAYDRERALRDFQESGYLEEGGLSARIFFEELKQARSFLTPFLNWVEARGGRLDESSWRDYQMAVPEKFA